MDNGKLTTIVSNVALIVSAYMAGQAISPELYVPVATTGVAMVIAYLDIRYPRYSEYVDRFFELVRKVDEERME